MQQPQQPQQSPEVETLLFTLERGFIEVAETLRNVTGVDPPEATGPLAAARGGHPAALRLVRRWGLLRSADTLNRCLTTAMDHDRLEAVRLLVEWGANVHAEPLLSRLVSSSCGRRRGSLAIALVLLQEGRLDPHTHNQQGEVALEDLARYSSFAHIPLAEIERLACVLLERGVGPGFPGWPEARQPLQLSIAGHPDTSNLVEIFLRAGAQVKWCHIVAAVRYQKPRFLRTLIEWLPAGALHRLHPPNGYSDLLSTASGDAIFAALLRHCESPVEVGLEEVADLLRKYDRYGPWPFGKRPEKDHAVLLYLHRHFPDFSPGHADIWVDMRDKKERRQVYDPATEAGRRRLLEWYSQCRHRGCRWPMLLDDAAVRILRRVTGLPAKRYYTWLGEYFATLRASLSTVLLSGAPVCELVVSYIAC